MNKINFLLGLLYAVGFAAGRQAVEHKMISIFVGAAVATLIILKLLRYIQSL